MELKNLVGKLAIRTARPDVTVDLHDLMNPLRIGAFCVGSEPWRKANRYDEQYMDTPVKIVSVKEEQVVVENTKDGRRKLLERKYMDDHWTDYERLLHPEEEKKEKAEKLMKEFEVAAEPIKHFLAEHYDPMCAAVINRASEGTCRQCGRRILWVRMKSGKNMPVDMALHNYKKDSTGKEKIVTPDGEVVTGRILVGERGDGAGYISHFASCKKYRR